MTCVSILPNEQAVFGDTNESPASGGDKGLKPALRTLARGLERCERGQREPLWVLYLALFIRLPGKGKEALSMAEEALE